MFTSEDSLHKIYYLLFYHYIPDYCWWPHPFSSYIHLQTTHTFSIGGWYSFISSPAAQGSCVMLNLLSTFSANSQNTERLTNACLLGGVVTSSLVFNNNTSNFVIVINNNDTPRSRLQQLDPFYRSWPDCPFECSSWITFKQLLEPLLTPIIKCLNPLVKFWQSLISIMPKLNLDSMFPIIAASSK